MANYIPAVPGPVTRPTTASQHPQLHLVPRLPSNQAIRAKLPQQQGKTLHAASGIFLSLTNIAGDFLGMGRTMWNSGAPVHNPSTGPVFQEKPAPVRFILPPWQPRAGRIGSSFGAPVINPIHGPPVTRSWVHPAPGSRSCSPARGA